MKIAIIPARGGSKRIPKKNIKLFNGKPMIGWSIAAAAESCVFDRIVVSTDDDEIADIALKLGAEVPFKRPNELAGDYTDTLPVIKHAIQEISSNEIDQRNLCVCCLYATAPLIVPDDLVEAYSVLTEETDYVFSATSFPFPPQRGFRVNPDGLAEMVYPENKLVRSQDLDEMYHDAGQFYWGSASTWISCKPIFGQFSRPFLLPRYRVQDIDTLEDWRRAEIMAPSTSVIGD